MKLNKENAKIAGVCAGLADYFKIDATFIRIAFIISVFLSLGTGFLAYLILWILMK